MVDKLPVKPAAKKAGADDTPKTVPLSDLLAQKARAEKAEGSLSKTEAELATERATSSRLKTELSIAQAEADDEGAVSAVKQTLLNQSADVEKREKKSNERESLLSEREKKIRVSELAIQYGVDKEVLMASDNVEEKALQLYSEQLTERETAVKDKEPETPGSVFDPENPSLTTKPIPEMSDEEFAQHEEKLKAESKK